MKTMAQELQELLNNLQEAEYALEILKKFEAEGGQYRLVLTAEHPDYQVRETVDRLAKAFVPKTTLLKGLITAAEKQVQKAKEAILTAAMSHGISASAQEHTHAGMVIQTRAAT